VDTTANKYQHQQDPVWEKLFKKYNVPLQEQEQYRGEEEEE